MSDTVTHPSPDAAIDDEVDDDEDLPPIHHVTPAEGREMFDDAARKIMGMSGEEFIARWEAGEYDDIFDKYGHRHIGMLAGLNPLARQEP